MKCPSCGNETPAEDASISGDGQLVCSSCAGAESLRETQRAAAESGAGEAKITGGLSRVKGALIMVVGVVALGGGVVNAWRAYALGSEGTPATGTVVELQHHPARRRRPAYTTAFLSVVVDGREHRCSIDDDEVSVGSEVPLEVAFVDAEIECEREGSNWKNWGLAGGLFCCLGPLALLIGFGMMFPEKASAD